MSLENKKTLEVYDRMAKNYIASTIKHDEVDPAKAARKREKLEGLIRESFGGFPEGAKFFEIGCADGTVSKFVEGLGFKATASDVAEDFVKAAREIGLEAIRFNALGDEFPEKYNGILAWRVFVHFTEEDAEKVIRKVYDALEDDGVFVFNAINRDFKEVDREWVDFSGDYHMGAERYYNYFRQETLDEIIGEAGFKFERFFKDGGESGEKWLIYVLKKAK
ncbi:MAG: methyltransferase domain-containing protein [Candidatus Saccharibacteria bacterium]|nr:methyltransferase domain-containing protein [Candidatus Saccharibacteria bacterium]